MEKKKVNLALILRYYLIESIKEDNLENANLINDILKNKKVGKLPTE